MFDKQRYEKKDDRLVATGFVSFFWAGFFGANEKEIEVEMNCFGSSFTSSFVSTTSSFTTVCFLFGLNMGSLEDKSTPLQMKEWMKTYLYLPPNGLNRSKASFSSSSSSSLFVTVFLGSLEGLGFLVGSLLDFITAFSYCSSRFARSFSDSSVTDTVFQLPN